MNLANHPPCQASMAMSPSKITETAMTTMPVTSKATAAVQVQELEARFVVTRSRFEIEMEWAMRFLRSHIQTLSAKVHT